MKHVKCVHIETCDDNGNWEIVSVPYEETIKQQDVAVVLFIGGIPYCASTTIESAEKTTKKIDNTYVKRVLGPSLYDYAVLVLEKMEANNG